MKSLRSSYQKLVNFIFKNFFCPRSDIRRLFFFLSLVFILTPSLASAAQVDCAWEESTGPDVAGYKVHYGNYSGDYQYTVDVGNITSCTISGLIEGTTYYFAATAYNTQQEESDYSNEVSYTVPDDPPPPSPTPDIKANGSDGPVGLTFGETLSVTIELNLGIYPGDQADWWCLADSPFGWNYYNNTEKWLKGLKVYYQGPLFELTPPSEVLNVSDLPTGDYTFYFGVDVTRNGNIDQPLYYDSVEVNITP